MKYKILPVLFFVAVIYPLASARAQSDSVTLKMDSIFKKYNNHTGPGCAVAVIKSGRIIFTKGYGMANLEYQIPITPSTVFDIASLSKQFTGFAISTLVEEGKIALSDDIRKYLPALPKFERTITIGNLVHHTSGIRDWPEALAAAGWKYSELCSFEDIMNMVKHQKELDFEPGTEESYSNTGYNILAALVEKVTGKTFRKWTNEHIFEPLQMTNTFVLDDNRKVIPKLAYSYYNAQGTFVKSQDILTAYGSSSLYSTMEDLAKWVIRFQKAISAKDPVYLRMLEGTTLNDGVKVPYGFGLETGEDHGYKSVFHTGAWAGYRTIIRSFPGEQLAVIILSNGNDNTINGPITENVVSLFLKDQQVKANPASQETLPSIKADPILLSKYTGHYKWRAAEVEISVQNGLLIFQYTGENKYPTRALSDSSFLLTIAGLPITFYKDKNGEVNSFRFRDMKGLKFTPYTTPPAELTSYEGTFYSEELQAQYQIRVQNGKLTVCHFRRGDFELSSDAKDEFTGDFGMLRFVRDAQQRVTGFKLSGDRVRNIRFEKK